MIIGPDDFLAFCHKTEKVEKKKGRMNWNIRLLHTPEAIITGCPAFFIYG
jgi:hypothetical protein